MNDPSPALPPAASAPSRIPIWPAPHDPVAADGEQELLVGQDLMVRNVVVPTLEILRPTTLGNGTAVVIAPGGVFHFLMVGYEGTDFADWLCARGVTAFLLRYRVRETPRSDAELLEFHARLVADLERSGAESHFLARLDSDAREAAENSISDARQAIRLVREQAGDWGLDPRRVGIAGFSAGGTIALAAALSADAASRPDFTAPIYPGVDAPIRVPAQAPPVFLAASQDDTIIPPSSCVAVWSAWRDAGRDAELHIFRSGGHGFGMKRLGLASDGWTDALERWLSDLGLLGRTAASPSR